MESYVTKDQFNQFEKDQEKFCNTSHKTFRKDLDCLGKKYREMNSEQDNMKEDMFKISTDVTAKIEDARKSQRNWLLVVATGLMAVKLILDYISK